MNKVKTLGTFIKSFVGNEVAILSLNVFILIKNYIAKISIIEVDSY